uniref:Uncharacterized protein n=1 Tax=Lactuca sativa TaxID=4236 RepID=A0A9R1XD45_LACSA|nr:hypothetical protein LSAT_V11C500243440 [Lactuca sativa]
MFIVLTRNLGCNREAFSIMHEWLTKILAKHRARSQFSGRAITDSLKNCLCEVFNSKLDEAKDKPIITCLELIVEYLTKKILNAYKVQENCKGSLSTTAKQS